MPEIYIGAVATTPLIVALVQLAKQVGLPSQYAPWLNAGLAVIFYVLAILIGNRPELLEPAGIALNAVIVFLSAAGFYTTAKFVTTARSDQ